MSDHINQDRIEALRNLLGEAQVDDRLLKLFRGGPFTAGAVHGQFFTPFRQRLAEGGSQPFREGNFSLKDFIQEVNKQLAEPTEF